MWQTLVSWSSASWVVQTTEAVAAWLVGVFRGCWLATALAREWDEHPRAYQESRIRAFFGGLCNALLNWQPLGTWWQGSWLLRTWPTWLASDLTWLWENSGLSRLWSVYGRLVFADDWNQSGEVETPAPPFWRVVLYGLLMSSAALAVWKLSFGLLVAKLLIALVALLLLWAQPNWASYVVAVALPILPALSTTYLILWAFLASWLQGRINRRGSLLLLLAGMLCLLLLLAALDSSSVLVSLRYWCYYLTGIALVILMVNALRTERAVRQFLGVALLAGSLVALWGIVQYALGTATNLSWVDIRYSAIKTRVVGTFDNPNMLAGYLVALLPFPLARMLQPDSSFRVRISNALLSALLGLVLVLTFSRGGWLAAFAAALVLVVYLQPRLFWVAPLIILAAPIVVPQVVWQRLASIVNLQDTSNMVRLYIWNSSLQMFLHNWWLGIGLGLVPFAAIYPIYQYGIVPALHAHNLFLQVAVEGGIFALICFILLSLGLWRAAVTRWQRMPWLATAAAAALIGHLTHGMFDYAWYDMRLLLTFWLIAGLILVGYRQRA